MSVQTIANSGLRVYFSLAMADDKTAEPRRRRKKEEPAVSPENRQRLGEWLTPGNIINLVGIAAMIVSVWAVNNYRLGDVSRSIEKIQADIAIISSDQKEVIRQQERLAALQTRVDGLELEIKTQAAINQTLFSKIARLER